MCSLSLQCEEFCPASLSVEHPLCLFLTSWIFDEFGIYSDTLSQWILSLSFFPLLCNRHFLHLGWLQWKLTPSVALNGNPLQYSCLENSMDRGAWWAMVHGVAKSWIRLSDFTFFLFSCYCFQLHCTHFSQCFTSILLLMGNHVVFPVWVHYE